MKLTNVGCLSVGALLERITVVESVPSVLVTVSFSTGMTPPSFIVSRHGTLGVETVVDATVVGSAVVGAVAITVVESVDTAVVAIVVGDDVVGTTVVIRSFSSMQATTDARSDLDGVDESGVSTTTMRFAVTGSAGVYSTGLDGSRTGTVSVGLTGVLSLFKNVTVNSFVSPGVRVNLTHVDTSLSGVLLVMIKTVFPSVDSTLVT